DSLARPRAESRLARRAVSARFDLQPRLPPPIEKNSARRAGDEFGARAGVWCGLAGGGNAKLGGNLFRTCARENRRSGRGVDRATQSALRKSRENERAGFGEAFRRGRKVCWRSGGRGQG